MAATAATGVRSATGLRLYPFTLHLRLVVFHRAQVHNIRSRRTRTKPLLSGRKISNALYHIIGISTKLYYYFIT